MITYCTRSVLVMKHPVTKKEIEIQYMPVMAMLGFNHEAFGINTVDDRQQGISPKIFYNFSAFKQHFQTVFMLNSDHLKKLQQELALLVLKKGYPVARKLLQEPS